MSTFNYHILWFIKYDLKRWHFFTLSLKSTLVISLCYKMGFTILVDLFLFLGFRMDLTFHKTIYKTKFIHHITFHTNKMTTYECKFTHVFILLAWNITVVVYLSHINPSLRLNVSSMWSYFGRKVSILIGNYGWMGTAISIWLGNPLWAFIWIID